MNIFNQQFQTCTIIRLLHIQFHSHNNALYIYHTEHKQSIILFKTMNNITWFLNDIDYWCVCVNYLKWLLIIKSINSNCKFIFTNTYQQLIQLPTYCSFAHLACSLNGLAESPSGWLTIKHIGNKLVLGRVHDEGTMPHVATNTQEWQVSNSALGYLLAIILLRTKNVSMLTTQTT